MQHTVKNMNDEPKTKETQNLGPVATELHKRLKMAAAGKSQSLRSFLEEHLGPLVDWAPESKSQLKMEGVA